MWEGNWQQQRAAAAVAAAVVVIVVVAAVAAYLPVCNFFRFQLTVSLRKN